MNPFKICSKCGYIWKVRDDFLKDPFICLVGFQAHPIETESGYYLFNHILEEDQCNTTLAVEVGVFLSLHKGAMFTDIKLESPHCELHCTRIDDLSRCSVKCKNAVARNVMQGFPRCKIL